MINYPGKELYPEEGRENLSNLWRGLGIWLGGGAISAIIGV